MRCSPIRWQLAAGLLAAVLGLFVVSSLAQAHALLVRSVPEANAELTAPPQTIEMWFSEPLEGRFSDARLVDSAGEDVPTGAAMVDVDDPTHMTLPLADLAPGNYTVVWRTLSSVDGHEWIGSFPVTLLNPDGSRPAAGAATVSGSTRGELPTPPEAISRGISLWGAVLLFGLLLFWWLAAQPLWTRAQAAGGTPAPLKDLVVGNLELGMLWGVTALVVGGWLQLGVQALGLGSLADLPELLLQTRPGNLVLYRQVLADAFALLILTATPHRRRWWIAGAALYTAALLAPVVWLAVQDPQPLPLLVFGLTLVGAGASWLQGRRPATRWGPVQLGAALLLGSVILLAFSLASHAAATPGRGWAVLGDWIHLAAAAAWLGGLLMLAWLIWQIRHRLAEIDGDLLLALVRRFSMLAGVSVFILAISGLFSSIVQLPALDALWTTTYGWVLVAKLALVALAMGLAFLNNRLAGRATWDAETGFRSFLRQVVGESAVGIAILAVVAVLVQTPVPQIAAPVAPVIETAYNDIVAADDLLMHLQVSPNQVGNNRFWAHLYHADGSDIGEVQLVRLLFEHQVQNLGQSSIDLEPLGQGTFAAEGAYLNQGGGWDLSVYVRRRGMDDVLTATTIDVPVPSGQVVERSPWQNPVAPLPGGLVIGGVLVSLGLVPLLWLRPLRRNRWIAYPALATLGALLIVAGVALGYTATSTAANPANLAGPPPPVTEDAIAAGGEFYQTLCADCHGLYGLGNGPAAASLPVPPAVLIFHVPQHEDAELYNFVSQGFPNLGMPAFGEQLEREEIWQIVHYLRNEFGGG